MRKWVAFIILFSTLWLGIARAAEFSSDNFVIKDPIVNLGGGLSGSESFQLNSNIGEEAIGISAGDSFGVNSGFLFFPSPSVIPTTPTVLSSGSFGGIFFRPILDKLNGRLCDFNSDNYCNIFDLSIFLYWINKPVELASPFDLNKDGKLNIVDISLMFYYWT